MRICHIVGAGPLYGALPRPEENDLYIAADGGLAHLKRHGIVPGLVLGDFDSLNEPPADLPVLHYPVKKDDSDSMLAIREGLRRGFDTFFIFGGMGGRPDHTLANMQALCFIAKRGGIGFLAGDGWVCTAVEAGGLRFLPDRGLLSVFCMGEAAQGVCLEGLEYPLSDAVLESDFPLGLSNRFAGREAAVSCKSGTLLVMWERRGLSRNGLPARFCAATDAGAEGVSRETTLSCALAPEARRRLSGVACALFDMDGTLIDSTPVWETLCADLLAARGIIPYPGLREEVRPLTIAQSALHLKRVYGLSEPAERIEADIRARIEKAYSEEVPAKPGALEFLRWLRRSGVRVSVATLTDRELAHAALSRVGLLPYIERIFTGREVGLKKGDPDFYHSVLGELGVRAEESAMFEDSLYAIRGARRAGLFTVAVYDPLSGTPWECFQKEADLAITDFCAALP